MTDRISALRTARGWSQTELAHRSGVTRQLIGALEAGRHSPNVAAALAIAAALGSSAEALFGAAEPAGGTPRDLLGAPIAPGAPVRAGRVGEQTVAIPAAYGADGSEAWLLADAASGGDRLDWLPGARPADLLVAGCDPMLGVLAQLVAPSGYRVLGVHASTGQSVQALESGRAHAVLVHGTDGDLPDAPVAVRRWHVASWQVGIAAAPTQRVAPRVDELAERRSKVVQRDAGAGTQRALVRALQACGAPPDLPGPVGSGHIDVARRLTYGGVRAGVLTESAASAFDLPFTPLEQHTVQLWIAEQWADLPAAIALLDVLSSGALINRARLFAGYDPSGCGVRIESLA